MMNEQSNPIKFYERLVEIRGWVWKIQEILEIIGMIDRLDLMKGR